MIAITVTQSNSNSKAPGFIIPETTNPKYLKSENPYFHKANPALGTVLKSIGFTIINVYF